MSIKMYIKSTENYYLNIHKDTVSAVQQSFSYHPQLNPGLMVLPHSAQPSETVS